MRLWGEQAERSFAHCYATGGLRLCPHFYHTAEHVERAVAGVDALRKLWA